jgi:RNA methyltransferase, TrmH family
MNPNPKTISSPQNERVKAVVRLRTARERRRLGLTIIEEPLVLARALAAGLTCAEVWYCPEQETASTAALRAELTSSAAETFEVPPQVMNKISYREDAEGLLAVAAAPELTLDELNLPVDRPTLLVVVENLEKPGNLGAVQRVADGVGADAVLVCGTGTDLYNPNVLRASRGACFHVPCLAAPGSEIRSFLAGHGIRIAAATPAAKSAWSEADLTVPVALVLGAEHEGLSESWLEAADLQIALPMRGIGDSLNISTTAAILLYECLRQRSEQPKAT